MNQAEVKRKQIQLYSYVACMLILLSFGKLLQNSGLTYFVLALETVLFVLQFCFGGVADVIGRMLRYRRKRGLYLNVCAVRKRLTLMIGAVGILGFILIFAIANIIANSLFEAPQITLLIRILTPIILIKALGSILQGYFQSFGSHVQTAIAAIIRPILYFLIGKALMDKTLAYGEKVSVLLQNETFHGMYGAIGLAVAVVISELIILLVFALFYFISDRNNDKRKSKEGLQRLESWSETIAMYTKLSAFGIFFGALCHIFVLTAMNMLDDKMQVGIYAGIYLAVCALPILLICARFYLLYAKTLYAVKGQNNRYIRDIIQIGMKYAWSFGILACVIPAVLAPQISATFFDRSEVVETVLQKGSLLIPFILLWIYFILIHMAHNRYMYVVLSGVVNFVLFIIFEKMLSGKTDSQMLAVVLAGIFAFGIGCVLFGVITDNLYRIQIEYISTFILPMACAGMIGLILMALSKILTPHIGNEMCFYVCACLGMILYLVFLGISRVFMERDINQIFGKIGRKVLSVFFK